MRTLHLTLKAQWYNMIESGEKKEEYREIKPYWMKRLCKNYGPWKTGEINGLKLTWYCECFWDCGIVNNGLIHSPYDSVCFHYGYTNRTMTFKIEDVHIGTGNPEWGAEEGKHYFVIKLGKRIYEKAE